MRNPACAVVLCASVPPPAPPAPHGLMMQRCLPLTPVALRSADGVLAYTYYAHDTMDILHSWGLGCAAAVIIFATRWILRAVLPRLRRRTPYRTWLEEHADKLSLRAALAVKSVGAPAAQLRRSVPSAIARAVPAAAPAASATATDLSPDHHTSSRRRSQASTGGEVATSPTMLSPSLSSPPPRSGREMRALALAHVCTRCGGPLVARTLVTADGSTAEGAIYLRCRSCRAKFSPDDLA